MHQKENPKKCSKESLFLELKIYLNECLFNENIISYDLYNEMQLKLLKKLEKERNNI